MKIFGLGEAKNSMGFLRLSCMYGGWRERRRRTSSAGERELGEGCVKGKEEKPQATLPKYPPSLFLFASSCLITSTASLVHIPNSKSESLIRPSIDYSFPNIYKGSIY